MWNYMAECCQVLFGTKCSNEQQRPVLGCVSGAGKVDFGPIKGNIFGSAEMPRFGTVWRGGQWASQCMDVIV